MCRAPVEPIYMPVVKRETRALLSSLAGLILSDQLHGRHWSTARQSAVDLFARGAPPHEYQRLVANLNEQRATRT